MNTEQLIAYYDNNNVKPYHNSKVLDALKHLSELPGIPREITEDYYVQYETALTQMGTRENINFNNLLYDKFIGEDPIIVGDMINSYTYRGVTFRSYEIHLKHFDRVAEYLSGIDGGLYRNKKHTYAALDIEVNGISTLQLLLQKPNSDRRYCFGSNKFFLCNEKEYAIVNDFYKPYNGIVANRVVEIFNEHFVKPLEKDRYSPSHSSIRSYVERQIKGFSYNIGNDTAIDKMLTSLKELLK